MNTPSLKTQHIKLLSIALLVLAIPGTAAAFDRIAVFGDSLSDAGNVFALTGQVSVRPYNASNIPDAPYATGGIHFSNGRTWIEKVGRELNRVPDVKASLRAPGTFSNYAFGGGRARSGASAVPALTEQVGMYLNDTGTPAVDTLHVIFIGGNDIRDALAAFVTDGPAAANQIITSAVTAIADNIQGLAAGGGQKFMVANAPDIGSAPAVTALGPQAAFLASQLSDAFNAALEGALSGLEIAFDISITRLDVSSIIRNIIADPAAYGLNNVTDACLTPETRKGAVCRKPDGYLFWDGIHPTRAAHALLAKEALSVLE